MGIPNYFQMKKSETDQKLFYLEIEVIRRMFTIRACTGEPGSGTGEERFHR
jgi:hypothetical protein